jgi:RND family efflux transporter MFP subunit
VKPIVKAPSRPRPLLPTVLVAVLGIFSEAAWSQPPEVLVETAPVRAKAVGETLHAYGVLEPDPDQVLSLSLPHGGLVNRIWVSLRQRVSAGDELIELVTAPDARMQFLQAQSAVDYAQRDLERQQRLLSEQLATKAQVDAAQKALHDAQATAAALRERGMDVAVETLRTPIDGVITRLDVAQGQRIQADSTAMLIAAEKHLVARLGIEPEDLDRLHPGLPISLSPVFVPDIRVETQVHQVHGMINPSTRLVDVLAPIPPKETDSLVLGSRVSARIRLPTHQALVVPRSAVLRAGKQAYLYLVEKGTAHRVEVDTGIEQGTEVEVSGALAAGDAVVVLGNYELHDGMSVRERSP